RLLNEAAALRLLKERTTIPVPTVYSYEPDDQGAMRLVVKRIHGIKAASVGEECRMPVGSRHVTSGTCSACENIATEKVNIFVEGTVLPQLRRLTSNQTGLDGFVLPPPRIEEYDRRAMWPPKQSPLEGEYVFCHGDLSRSNIMVDPNTLDVVYIIDWEQAGFFPATLERPLWRLDYREYMQTYEDHDMLDGEIALITG
ncbi:hypothetical protein BU23DRAFT_472247, partial [Bimuria novae-zelandiae CBS 107.79]